MKFSRHMNNLGGAGRSERQMDGFRDAVAICGLSDLGFTGLPYTWDNRQQGDQNIKVRLDRGLATTTFVDLFAEVNVKHIQTAESDHCCLLIECMNEARDPPRKKASFQI